MTRREAERLTHQQNTLMSLGFTREEAEALRRISMTLHCWAEHECNGTIQREGENGDGRPRAYNPNTGRMYGYVPDRERGALKRLQTIIDTRNARVTSPNSADAERNIHAACAARTCGHDTLSYYVQGDPRGCALYILRPGDVPDGQRADGYYSRGIAIY